MDGEGYLPWMGGTYLGLGVPTFDGGGGTYFGWGGVPTLNGRRRYLPWMGGGGTYLGWGGGNTLDGGEGYLGWEVPTLDGGTYL